MMACVAFEVMDTNGYILFFPDPIKKTAPGDSPDAVLSA
jgi:hypothetical protein